MTGSVLTDASEGETPMVPSEIMQYSIDSCKKTDIQTSLKVLSSPSNEFHTIPGADTKTDPVVRYIVNGT